MPETFIYSGWLFLWYNNLVGYSFSYYERRLKMGYGEESLSAEQKEQFGNALTIKKSYEHDHFRGEGIDYQSGFVWNGLKPECNVVSGILMLA